MTLPLHTKVYCGHEYTQKNLHFAQLVEPNNKKISERLAFVTKLISVNQPSLPSTLAIEKETNPFLRSNVVEIKTNIENFMQKKLSHPIDTFTELRKWKDQF